MDRRIDTADADGTPPVRGAPSWIAVRPQVADLPDAFAELLSPADASFRL